MQIPISRRGGAGGTDLNFTVVGGTTQPSNPKENTIWVNTDQEITGWVFSAEEPTDPVDGMVWIGTVADRTANFNVLKENEIWLSIECAYVYVADSWKKVEGYISIADAWIKFSNIILYLYSKGTESVTWTNSSGGGTGTKTATKQTSDLYLYATYTSGSYSAYASFYTPNAVDITGFSRLNANVNISDAAQQASLVIAETASNAAATTNDSGTHIATAGKFNTTGSFTLSIPLSEITLKKVYIGIGVGSGYGDASGKMTVTDIWLD